jgi:DNA-binding NarL/FixJ family response regulator
MKTSKQRHVKNHISNILSRLGLRDRTQAAIYAREHALL